MKAMFTGDPKGGDDSAGVRLFERLFPAGQEVDVSDMPLEQQRKIAGNNHFVVSGVPGEPAAAAPPAEKRKKG